MSRVRSPSPAPYFQCFTGKPFEAVSRSVLGTFRWNGPRVSSQEARLLSFQRLEGEEMQATKSRTRSHVPIGAAMSGFFVWSMVLSGMLFAQLPSEIPTSVDLTLLLV